MSQIEHAKARTPEGRWLRGVHVRVTAGPDIGVAGYVAGYAGAQVLIERAGKRLAVPAEAIGPTGQPAGQPAAWTPQGPVPLGLFTDEELTWHAGVLAARSPFGRDLVAVRSELSRRYTPSRGMSRAEAQRVVGAGWARADDPAVLRRHGRNVLARDWNGTEVAGLFDWRKRDVTPPGGAPVQVRYILAGD